MNGPTSDYWGYSCAECGHSQPLYEHLPNYAPGCMSERGSDGQLPNHDPITSHDHG